MTVDPGVDGGVEFDLGYAAGTHPRFDDRRSPGSTTTTTVSAWLGLVCARCRHTFRIGDRVRVVDDAVEHLDPVLRCAVEPDGSQDDEGVADFARGLLDAWPPASGQPRRLAEDDWSVPRRGLTTSSPTCPVCAHTFRPGDAVVRCPCALSVGQDDRPRCELLVHRDPVRGLTCWDDWRPDGTVVRCPITHEPPR